MNRRMEGLAATINLKITLLIWLVSVCCSTDSTKKREWMLVRMVRGKCVLKRIVFHTLNGLLILSRTVDSADGVLDLPICHLPAC